MSDNVKTDIISLSSDDDDGIHVHPEPISDDRDCIHITPIELSQAEFSTRVESSILSQTPTRRESLNIGNIIFTREEALELPSSPPLAAADDEIDGMNKWRLPNAFNSSPPLPRFSDDFADNFDDNDCQILDDFIDAQAHVDGAALNMATSILGLPLITSNYSDSSVATDILSSSENEENQVLYGQRRFSRRAMSMDDEARITQSMSLATDIGRQSSRVEKEAGRCALAEKRIAERAEKRQRKEREREFQRGLSSVNKKKVDFKDLARDMTLVADPGLLQLLGEPKRTASATTAIDGEDTSEHAAAAASLEVSTGASHPVFGHLLEEGIAWRVEPAATASAVHWEMRVRRKWESSLNLYVPLAHPRVVKVRSAAMVVIGSKRFVEMVAADRIAHRLGIWRAVLAVKRLFVVVVGLQKYLHKTANAETREFARQMRQHLKDGGGGSSQPLPRQQQQQADSASAAMGSLTQSDIEEAVLRLHMTCPWTSWFTQCSDTKGLSKLLWQATSDIARSEFYGDKGGENNSEFSSGSETNNGPSPLSFVTSEVVSGLRAAVVRALTQIPKVTQPVAQSIIAKYPTPRRLFDAWRDLGSEPKRELMLAQLTTPGHVMSGRIYRFFNEPDPTRPFAEL
ncbi:hypothetical protein BX661DRAFT_200692 [Kickxella alabastrina]|uniref:uncharacterized protein n=1 Tax=Kickxella alabastrina TaxID=61397 RepID=UPI00221F8248|nr:uncharacterized protein BX661DRAFT_200692 [Kickxella alabastrina]KAI7821452.1 hypothetical protein BX661DRAFT_200692 [Kickxella alabastrina]